MTYKATSIPAPVGGLNDRDSLAVMPATDAVIMDNCWPYPSYVGVRKGSTNHVTGFAAEVETLVEYLPESGALALFAAAGAAFYNVTTAGAVGAAVQSGLTNARWQHAQITTPGGSYLYMVNGADKPRLWDGATWVSVDGVSTPAITGLTTTNLVHVAVYKNRLFFTQNSSLELAYLPALSIGGAASFLDCGSIFRQGGYIMACYPWTVDAGDGADDHLVIITSMGEVAVYTGTDPSSATDWRLVGVFQFGKPLGRRCGVKYGGDLAMLTTEGVYPLAKGLLSASIDRRAALSDKVQNTLSAAANAASTSFGWQLALYPDANMLIVNVVTSAMNVQLAMNTITGAWTKFSGWDANVWLSASSGLYYGGATAVYKAWTGNVDVAGTIRGDVLPAFGYFGSKAFNKYFTMIRPYLQSDGTPSIRYALCTDFAASDPTGALPYVAPTGMVWGSMVWGSMVWGGGLTQITGWRTVGKVSNSAALRLQIQNNGAEVRYISVDYGFQPANSVL